MIDEALDMNRAKRKERQQSWEAGVAWCGEDRLIARALAAAGERDAEGQYLFLLGVAQTLSAAGRDIAGIDTRKER